MTRRTRPKSLTLGEEAETDASTFARALGLDEKRGSSAAIRFALSFTVSRLEQAVKHAKRRAPKAPRAAAAPIPKRWVDRDDSPSTEGSPT